MRLASFVCSVVLVASIVAIGEPAASAATAQEDIVVDGTTHVFHYDTRIPVRRRNAAKEAFTRVMNSYPTLFGVNNLEVHTFFENVPNAIPSTMAVAGYIANSSAGKIGCNLTIYRHRELLNDAALKFTMAHELAHCFMFALRPDMRSMNGSLAAPADPNAWWVEGAAEYFATTLYRPAGAVITETLANFSTIVPDSVFDNDYKQFWFFQFLGGARGAAAVVGLIRDIPITRAAQITWLQGPPLGPHTALFVAYAKGVAGRTIARQPATASNAVPFGFEGSLETREWSVSTRKFRLPALRPGFGVTVAITANDDPSSYRLVTPTEDITDGYSSCGGPAPRELSLAVARTVIAAGKTDAAIKVKIDQVECQPPVTLASFEGRFIGGTDGAISVLADPSSSFPDDKDRYVTIESTKRPNTFAFDASGNISGSACGTQHSTTSWAAFRPSPISGRFTLGRVLKTKGNAVLLEATVSMAGTASGSGGITQADKTAKYQNAVSLPMVFPTLNRVECANITIASGVAKCGMIVFLEGNRPRFSFAP